MTDLASRLERLTPEQRRLFELRRAGRRAPVEPEPEAPPAPDLLPLTPEQEQSWDRARRLPDTAYNYGIALRLVGDLDVPALEHAIQHAVARHPALRATVVVDGDRPLQRIAPPGPVALEVAQLGEGALAAHLHEFVDRRFDGRGGRPWRARLLRLGPRTHVLALVVDHLSCDGRSRIKLVDELLECYDARRAGRPPRLPELALGYGEYIAWRRRWLRGSEAAAHAAAWREDLAGAELLPLRGDRPRPRERRFRGARLSYPVPPTLLRRLRALAGREGATTYVVLLAAFSALLARYAGRSDVVVSTHVFNRLAPGSEHLVGNFTSYVLQRCRWSGDPTFQELLGLARAVTLRSAGRQGVPAAAVIDDLGWADPRLMTPISQFHLVVHDAHGVQPVRAETIEAHDEPFYAGRFGGDLGLFAHDTEAELEIMIEYGVALFDEPAVQRLRDHLAALLQRAAAAPERRLGDLCAGIDRLAVGRPA